MAFPAITPSPIDLREGSLAEMFIRRANTSRNREAYRYPTVDGTWASITWGEAGERVRKLAAGLLALGITPEDRVGIASATRLEWILADLATMCAGGATTTVYPTTIAPDVAYILSDSETRILFAEDDEQIEKIEAHRADLPALTKIVVFDGTTDGDWVIDLDDLATLGEKHLAEHPDAVDRTVDAIRGDQLATLIYTSGTTGRPKGVRLAHDTWTYQGAVARSHAILDENDMQYLWLPMAHSFGKVLLSSQLAVGFATAVDGRVDRIVDNIAVVQPTFMGAAPRIFEKIYTRIMTTQETAGGAQRRIFDAAFSHGRRIGELRRTRQPVPLHLRLQQRVFERLVFSKIRARFGGNLRFFISGSAALSPDIAEWFDAAGIVILEGYGLTETSAAAFMNHTDNYKIGTVGTAHPGSEARIGEGDEIEIRGPHVMGGYHNLPDATAEAFTPDGWLRTGDKGSIDSDGFLTITGRIKELFKTSGGKYVAPPAIEAKFKALCPYASQFMVFGDQRNYCIALVVLDPDAITAWAGEIGLEGLNYAELTASEQVRDLIERHVAELNNHLNRWETIKRFEILDHDLSVESGELTPSLKVRRNVVQAKHQQTIDGLYN